MDERASGVIEIDDDWVPADIPLVKPTMTIKTEPEDIPAEPEEFQEVLRRGQTNRVQRVPFTPRMEGQHYKEVGFLEKEEFRGDADISEDIFQTGGAEELNSLRAAECVLDGTRAAGCWCKLFWRSKSEKGRELAWAEGSRSVPPPK